MNVVGYGILFFVAINSPIFYYINHESNWDYTYYKYKNLLIFGSLMPTISWIIHGLLKEDE
jgi:hypothetical protein